MLSAIDELFFKEHESSDFGAGDRYKIVVVEEEKREKELLEILKDNAEAVNVFNQYQFAVKTKAFEEIRHYYKSGFRSGFRIALDAQKEE